MTEWIFVNAMLQSMTTVEDLIVGHMVFFLVVHELDQKIGGWSSDYGENGAMVDFW